MKLHLLDTQALVWLMLGNQKLGLLPRDVIDEARVSGRLAVSAFTF